MKVLVPFVCIVLFVAFTTADTVRDSADEIENDELSLEKRQSCPTLTFQCGPGTTMPAVCKNMRDAIAKDKHPTRLHYVSGQQARRNRRASGCPELTKMSTIPHYNCDEYPFASSKEGGKGAKIMMVPASENSQQGGLLGSFYKKHSFGPGDCYDVVVQ